MSTDSKEELDLMEDNLNEAFDLDDNGMTELFSFETDHIALRENKDYKRLLSTVALLEAQRAQATQDLDALLNAQKEAFKNPIAFVQKLQQKADLDIPSQIKVASVPTINWKKYIDLESSYPSNPVQYGVTTRRKYGHVDGTDSPKDTGSNPEDFGGLKGQQEGRDIKKSENFNVLWTTEEQQRLEELLTQYPPEEVETRRWEKIARALGNRTTLQVASRVQKYFIKLAKAGLPIPGRMPNLAVYKYKDKKGHRHQRHNHFLYQPSTFLQAYEPPVYMAEDDNDDTGYTAMGYNNTGSYRVGNQPMYNKPTACNPGNQYSLMEAHDESTSDEEDIPLELRDSPQYRAIIELKKQKKRLQEKREQQTTHYGYRCDVCDKEPIVGTRWHCLQCPPDMSTDFCDRCVSVSFSSECHQPYHEVKAIHTSIAKPKQNPYPIDNDYTQAITDQSSYLDPNYIPAT